MGDTTATAAPDGAVLADWLEGAGIGLEGALAVEIIAGGRSNLTYALADEAGRRLVLRRPPGGSLLDSAHDMSREWRFIDALHPTDVPVPEPFAFCDDATVIGVPFYIMGFVDGVVLESPESARSFTPELRDRLGRALVATMSTMHAVDPAAVGLADIARGEGYLARQLKRWQRQWEQSVGPAGVDEPLMADLHTDLVRLAPPQRRISIVHGDFRLGNVISGPAGTIEAVLDWELATLGDPLADLGWLLSLWSEPGDAHHVELPTDIGGFPSRAELIAQYAAATGSDPADIDYYVAFACWRLAAIQAGVSARYQAGAMGADGTDPQEQAALLARRIRHLARRAREILDRVLEPERG